MSFKKSLVLVAMATLMAPTAQAATHNEASPPTVSTAPRGQSDLGYPSRFIRGLKYPNNRDEGTAPIESFDQPAPALADATGFTTLLPYVTPAPDQLDAGSCLYMSLTGSAEWWLRRLNPQITYKRDGDLDLSERYLMNLSGIDDFFNSMNNWKTDSITLFNKVSGGILNRDYRFRKGWFKSNANGAYVVSNKDDTDASYGTSYSWIDERFPRINSLERVKLPYFSRKVLFADPASNQWNTGVMPTDIAERIKTALVENQAPVQVIYNHFGYWHAVLVVGYDDAKSTENCAFTQRFLTVLPEKAQKLRTQAEASTSESRKANLIYQAKKLEDAARGAQKSFDAAGGCQAQGMFYVRDSIYGYDTEPHYDYDKYSTGDEGHYSLPLVMREYDWVRHLGNHALVITAQPRQ